MNRQWIVISCLAGVVACGVAACGDGRGGQPAGTAEETDVHGAAAPRDVHVAPELQEKWGVKIEPVVSVDVASTIVLPGILGVDQQQTAQISTLLEGKVVAIRADLGTRVRRGQVMLVVHAPSLSQAKSAFLRAYARRNLAQTEAERARTLLQQEVIQQKELQRREAEYEDAATEFGVLESNLHSFGLSQADVDGIVELFRRQGFEDLDHRLTDPTMPVSAPVDGQVIFRDVIAGEFVTPEKTLFTITSLGTLWADLDARERDLPALEAGRRVVIASSVYPDREFRGRILHVGDVVDQKLRTIKVRVEVDNAEGRLKPNMFVQGRIEAAAGSRRVLAVPDEAVQTLEGESVVFVRQGPDTFAARVVALGERLGRLREVVQGLAAGDPVVVAGAFTLKAELLKGTLSGDHSH